jgi:hypothetical protein
MILFEVDATVYNTRNGFRVGSPYLLPDFYVKAKNSEEATEKAMLILGPIARKAQKFDIKIEEVAT